MNLTILRTSIKRQLLALLLLSSLFAISVSGALFAYSFTQQQEAQNAEYLENYASLITDNAERHLTFQNHTQLDLILERFTEKSKANQVAIFKADGNLVSYYPRTDWVTKNLPKQIQQQGKFTDGKNVHQFFPITGKNGLIGALYMGKEITPLLEQLQGFFPYFALATLVAFGFVYFIYRQIHLSITKPIDDITEATKNFSVEKNYSLRLPMEREDELGDLVHGVNEMLNQLQLRDRVMTEQLQLKADELKIDHDFVKTALDNVNAALLIFNKEDERVKSFNQPFYSRYKIAPEGLTIQDVLNQLHLEDHVIDSVTDGSFVNDSIHTCRDHANAPQFVELHLNELPGGNDQLLIINNVTLRKLTEEALIKEKKRAQVTLDSIADGVLTTDTEGNLTYMNPVAEKYTGREFVEVKGYAIDKILKIFDLKNHIQFDNPINEYISGKSSNWKPDGMLVTPDRQEFFVENSLAPLKNERDELMGAVVVFRDVTRLHRLIQKISYQASHDSLTGLVNRGEFEKRLKSTLINAKHQDSTHCLLYLDLDKFKAVNDTCGHAAGDQMLCQIANIIHNRIRQRDTFARVGGDEFGIILEHCKEEKALRIAGEIQSDLNDYQFNWKEHIFRTSVSIGAVEITEESGEYVSVLSLADSACYAAKEAGRNRVYLYQQDDIEFAQRYGDVFWVSKITRAMEENRFYLVSQRIQPISSTEQGEHYEILIRMLDENGETVSPAVFLGAAERYNLNAMIDKWVVETALKTLESNPQRVTELALCSINLSGPTFTDDKFLDYLYQRLTDSVVPAEKICFEITETAAVYSFEKARNFMAKIRSLGCRFGLDDFGTGMSSFAYLKNLPADFLKIDGVFVRNIADNPVDAAMVKSINEIGHVMGMKTIAEFAENDPVIDKLTEIGVDYAQGYGIQKPVPFTDVSINTAAKKVS